MKACNIVDSLDVVRNPLQSKLNERRKSSDNRATTERLQEIFR
ncbi:hypothetical protein ACVIVD_005624 [Bradyrhizobium liaoningense]